MILLSILRKAFIFQNRLIKFVWNHRRGGDFYEYRIACYYDRRRTCRNTFYRLPACQPSRCYYSENLQKAALWHRFDQLILFTKTGDSQEQQTFVRRFLRVSFFISIPLLFSTCNSVVRNFLSSCPSFPFSFCRKVWACR